MDDLVVKVHDSNSRPSNGADVYNIFSEHCGEIRNIYPYRADKSSGSAGVQWFVEFVNQPSVERACKLSVDDILVLAMTPSLMREYRSIVAHPATPEESSRVQYNPRATTAPGSSHPALESICVRDGDTAISSPGKLSNKPARRSRLRTEEIDVDCSRALSPAPPSSTVPSHQLPCPGPSTRERTFLETLKSSKPSLLSRLHGKHEKENVLLEPSTAGLSLPPTPLSVSRPLIPVSTVTKHEASNQHATIVSAPSFTLDTRLVMTLCGELISYDLETLEDDPRAIVDLLKATSSERDKWITVGCHYRRKGNFTAAISVVSTMIQVMVALGMLESDLKPAFLMLSSCETELCKRSRTPSGENTEASLGHSEKSYHWLQKVYGANAESNRTGNFNLAPAARLSPKPITKSSNVRTPNHIRSATSSQPTRMIIDLSDKTPKNAPSTPKHTPAAVPTSPSRLKMLERELQSVRDSEKSITTQLHSARSTKRKFEDDFAAERAIRRKLERRLEDLEGQLDVSKKMEKFALEQLKLEVEARRRAEGRAECEREKRREVQNGVKARAKPLFEDLAEMFQRAAKGENIVLPNVIAGSGTGQR